MLDRLKKHPAYPYVAPFLLFMIFLVLEGLHPSALYVVYPIKTAVVGLFLLYLFARLPAFDLKQPWLAVSVGLGVFLLWVGLGPKILWGEIKPGSGFNPFLFQDPQIAWGLIAIRIFGAAVVVPVMEELFWRGFLMRYLIKENFEEVRLGTYTHFSFWVTALLFASVHGSFAPVAFLTGLIYGALFVKTKSLGAVILAHAITNLLLGLYVVQTGQWFFW
ncbi:MAG: CAAX prenyl protease-related protein [Blastochloris sp.]|nr:CAAX prenyl protease-related protein [Blastochloris sp.]